MSEPMAREVTSVIPPAPREKFGFELAAEERLFSAVFPEIFRPFDEEDALEELLRTLLANSVRLASALEAESESGVRRAGVDCSLDEPERS